MSFFQRVRDRLAEAQFWLTHSRRTSYTEEELYAIDEIMEPDPTRPGHFTRDSLIKVIQYEFARGFSVKNGDIVGGDSFFESVDDELIKEAKRRLREVREK